MAYLKFHVEQILKILNQTFTLDKKQMSVFRNNSLKKIYFRQLIQEYTSEFTGIVFLLKTEIYLFEDELWLKKVVVGFFFLLS